MSGGSVESAFESWFAGRQLLLLLHLDSLIALVLIAFVVVASDSDLLHAHGLAGPPEERLQLSELDELHTDASTRTGDW
jgi:hypothetical protein